MTATAFSLQPQPTPDGVRGGSWLAPTADRPRLRLIEGAGLVEVPVHRVDPMIEVYRRRRFLVAVVLTVVVLALAQIAGVSVTSFGPLSTEADAVTPLVHVVQPGDTYAAIAATLGADDPVQSASELRAANGGADLVVGQRIIVSADVLRAGR